MGDAEFQKKCLGKMGEVARCARTILFVSHNLSAVQQLCDRVILLADGQIISSGSPASVIHEYLSSNETRELLWENPTPRERTRATIARLFVSSADGRPLQSLSMSDQLAVVVEYELAAKTPDLQVNLQLTNHLGDHIVVTTPQDNGVEPPDDGGRYRCRVSFPGEILLSHRYGLRASLWTPPSTTLAVTPVLYFDVHEATTFASLVRDGSRRSGHIALKCDWQIDGA